MATSTDSIAFDPTDNDFDPDRLQFIRATDIEAHRAMHRQYVIAHAKCDQCGAIADTIHILPGVSRPTSVELACPDCDPGGYWFPIYRWFDRPDAPDDWHRPGMKYTTRQHILVTKSRGAMAVGLIEERLQFWGD
jgi:hypothetical protein